MKKTLLVIFFTCYISIFLKAQPKEKTEIFQGNYYSPFHKTIRDSIHKTVSKYGLYIAYGLGRCQAYHMGGLGGHMSASLAYKNFLFSVTAAAGDEGAFMEGLLTNHRKAYSFAYLAIAAGEAIRFKHGLISLSVGLGLTGLELSTYNPDLRKMEKYNKNTISVPVELRLFLLAYRDLGIGLTLNKDFIPKIEYSPSIIGVCIVHGIWNDNGKKQNN